MIKLFKILKLFFWPILLTITQFILITLFTLLFNYKYINGLKVEYPKLNQTEINLKFEEISNTEEYIYELSDYLNNNGTIIVIITLILLLPFILKTYNKLKSSNIKKLEFNKYLKIIVFSILLSIGLNIIMYLINSLIPITNRYDDIKALFYTIIPTGIIGPILEEYIFRGIIFNKLKTFNNSKKSIVLATIIFSIMHFELSQIIYTLVVGFYLTYIYFKTNNITVPTIAHITINTTTIILLPLILNTNIYTIVGILILIILSFYQMFSIKQK